MVEMVFRRSPRYLRFCVAQYEMNQEEKIQQLANLLTMRLTGGCPFGKILITLWR